jgi:predicted dehydrogenase
MTLHGTDAQAWLEADGARLVLARRGQKERTEVPLTSVDPIVEELTEFARCVRNGAKPETDGEVGVANIAVLEAIVQSSDSGRAVDVKR